MKTTHTETIRLYRTIEGYWKWKVEYYWAENFHPYEDEGYARFKWQAKLMAKICLKGMHKKSEALIHG